MAKTSGGQRSGANGNVNKRIPITQNELRKIVGEIIKKTPFGMVKNKQVSELTAKYYITHSRSKGKNDIVTAVQNALNYYAFSPTQKEFRKRYMMTED
jgi:hypothetical protein